MKIHTFDTETETARAVTHQLLKQLNTVRQDTFNLAISGGHTSEALFRLWAGIYSRNLPWQRVHLYWVDERCVAPTDGNSNYGMAKRLFLDKIQLPREQIHRIMGEANPEYEARRYSELVQKNLPDQDGFPRFDMLILGMGTDGHTASIFPEQKYLLNFPHPYAPSFQPDTVQRRITITGQPILRAALTLYQIVGAEKAEMLARILYAHTGAEEYPTGYIAQNADRIEFFIDSAAAQKLHF